MSDFDASIIIDDLLQILALMQDDLCRAERLGRPTINAHCVQYHRARLLEVIQRIEGEVKS